MFISRGQGVDCFTKIHPTSSRERGQRTEDRVYDETAGGNYFTMHNRTLSLVVFTIQHNRGYFPHSMVGPTQLHTWKRAGLQLLFQAKPTSGCRAHNAEKRLTPRKTVNSTRGASRHRLAMFSFKERVQNNCVSVHRQCIHTREVPHGARVSTSDRLVVELCVGFRKRVLYSTADPKVLVR